MGTTSRQHGRAAAEPHATRTRDETGAVVPFIAILMVVIIGIAMLAVDLGMQRVARQDMQRLADAVALDLSRLIDGRTASQIQAGDGSRSSLAAAKAASVARNSDTILGRDTEVVVDLIELDGGGAPKRRSDGGIDVATGSTVPGAVMVRAVTTVDFSFAPGSGSAGNGGDGGGEGGGTTRPPGVDCPGPGCAFGVPRSNACFRLGSMAAGIDLAQSNLLNAVMPRLLNNSTFSATLVGYQGLAGSTVTLANLAAVSDLSVGSPDELLKLGGLTLGRFYAALATALQANGGSTASVTLLQTLSTKANLTSTLAIRDVLNIETARTAALAAQFDVLSLVVGAAYAVNGTNTLSVPGLSTQVPGLTSLTSSLLVGAHPRLACGEVGHAQAQTGQVDLKFSGNLSDVTSNVSGLTTALGPLGAVSGGPLTSITQGVLSGALTAKTYTESELLLAKATGSLTNIVCGAATATTNAEGINVDVTASAVSLVSTSESVRITGNLDLKITTLLGASVKIATVTVDLTKSATASTSQPTSASNLAFRHPTDDYSTPKTYGSGIVLNNLTAPTVTGTDKVRVTFNPGYGTTGDVNVASVNGLSAVLNTLFASATTSTNTNVVSPVNTQITPQLSKQVGVRVGGADLYAVPRPSCTDPALAG